MTLRAILTMLLFFCFSSLGFASEQVFFYHTDPAGTPLSMTDSNGAVVWKADYKPFGEEYAVTGSAINDKRFVGKEKDEESGLSYFGARYEDAKIGRFTAVDPIRAVDPQTSQTNEKMLLNPQRLNTYAYALNNPYRFVDPYGNDPISLATVAFLANLLFGGTANAPEYKYTPTFQSQSATQFAFETALMEGGGRLTGEFIGMLGKEAAPITRSLGAAALKTYFPEAKMIAKIFGVAEKDFHQVVKKEILGDAGTLPKWLGKNPDIGFSEPGNIVLRDVKTKREFVTNLTVEGYKR